jgi:hypothetical protein
VVPTSVAKRDDRFYVGNLGLFPIVVGSSKLYQVTHEGFIIDYWSGFTTIVDIRVDAEGRMYVLELSSAAGNPSPGAGRILRITGTLVEEIVSGLFVPTGMALDQHGDIYVSDLGAAPRSSGSHSTLRESRLWHRYHHRRSPKARPIGGRGSRFRRQGRRPLILSIRL